MGKNHHGALAQLVARYIRIVEVSGSNPLCSTKNRPKTSGFRTFLYLFILFSDSLTPKGHQYSILVPLFFSTPGMGNNLVVKVHYTLGRRKC